MYRKYDNLAVFYPILILRLCDRKDYLELFKIMCYIRVSTRTRIYKKEENKTRNQKRKKKKKGKKTTTIENDQEGGKYKKEKKKEKEKQKEKEEQEKKKNVVKKEEEEKQKKENKRKNFQVCFIFQIACLNAFRDGCLTLEILMKIFYKEYQGAASPS